MSELPADWKWSTLGAVCEKPQYGWTTSATDSGKIRLLRTTDLTHGPITWDTVPYCKEAPGSIDKFLVQPNDIFISRAGSVGVSVLVKDVPEKSVFASYLIRLRPTTQVDPRFLSLFLLSPGYWTQVSEMSSGIALANINATKIQSMKIPLPPIAEQHQIVEILEDHLSRLDAALADVQQAQDKNGSFVNSLLFSTFESFANSKTRIVILKDLVLPNAEGILVSQGWSPKCESEAAVPFEEWGVLKTTSIQKGRFSFEHNKKLPKNVLPRENLEVKVGDFLITRKGPRWRCGIPSLVRETAPKMMFPDVVYRFRVNPQIVDSNYLEFSLLSPQIQNKINELKTGGNESGMNLTHSRLLNLQIHLPSLSEQVDTARNLRESIDSMHHALSSVSAMKNQSSSFRRSLLQAAFTGQLTREATHV